MGRLPRRDEQRRGERSPFAAPRTSTAYDARGSRRRVQSALGTLRAYGPERARHCTPPIRRAYFGRLRSRAKRGRGAARCLLVHPPLPTRRRREADQTAAGKKIRQTSSHGRRAKNAKENASTRAGSGARHRVVAGQRSVCEPPVVHDPSWQSLLLIPDTVAQRQRGHGRRIYPRHEKEVQEQEKTTPLTPQETT